MTSEAGRSFVAWAAERIAADAQASVATRRARLADVRAFAHWFALTYGADPEPADLTPDVLWRFDRDCRRIAAPGTCARRRATMRLLGGRAEVGLVRS